jgi:hypothetical protein
MIFWLVFKLEISYRVIIYLEGFWFLLEHFLKITFLHQTKPPKLMSYSLSLLFRGKKRGSKEKPHYKLSATGRKLRCIHT